MNLNLKRVISFATLGLGGLLMSGCASIVTGRHDSISIRSDPSDAEVRITDARTGYTVQTGKTPMQCSLDRGRGYFSGAKYQVHIGKPGYEEQSREIDSHVGGWYLAGNLGFGGLIGWLIVDPATGAMWSLSPDEFSVTLKEKAPPAASPVAAIPNT
jgi:PEGA domain